MPLVRGDLLDIDLDPGRHRVPALALPPPGLLGAPGPRLGRGRLRLGVVELLDEPRLHPTLHPGPLPKTSPTTGTGLTSQGGLSTQLLATVEVIA